jgi:hypothetical protein
MSTPIVQSQTGYAAAATLNMTMSDTTNGDSILVAVACYANPFTRPTVTVTDSQGNTYAAIANSNPSMGTQGSNQGVAFLFLASGIGGGPNVITIARSPGGAYPEGVSAIVS